MDQANTPFLDKLLLNAGGIICGDALKFWYAALDYHFQDRRFELAACGRVRNSAKATAGLLPRKSGWSSATGDKKETL